MIALDTSTIIDIFKGSSKVRSLIEKTEGPFVVTLLSYLELMFGIDYKNKANKIEEKYYDDFFNSFLTLDLTKESCKKAAQIHKDLEAQGKTIEQFDCVIVAILLTNGIKTIITGNKKHFEDIKELKVISY